MAYLEIFDVIIPNAIRRDLIQYDIPVVKDLRRDMDDEAALKKRLLNARYCMTLAPTVMMTAMIVEFSH